MPRILITADRRRIPAARRPEGAPLHVEVITLSDIDGIYTLRCTGDTIDECPGDIEAGDTWSDLRAAVEEAVTHVALHEQRVCPTCAGRMVFEFGHSGPNGEFQQWSTCQSCGATEVRS